MNSHHILLHSSIHIIQVLHLLWLVIAPQRATTPSPDLMIADIENYLEIEVQNSICWVTFVPALSTACCHLKVKKFDGFEQNQAKKHLVISSTPAILDPKSLFFNFQSSWCFSEIWYNISVIYLSKGWLSTILPFNTSQQLFFFFLLLMQWKLNKICVFW